MKTSSKALTLLGACISILTVARAAAPVVQRVTATSVSQGEVAALHADVSDADGDLAYVAFYISGPGIYGRLHVGDRNVSGTSAAADITWTATQAGVLTVWADVADTATTVSGQNSFEVFIGKLTVAPVTIANGTNRIYQYGGEILTAQNDSAENVSVQNGGNLILWSGGRVTLKPGFHAHEGAYFWAAVDHNMNGYSDLEETECNYVAGVPDAWLVDHGFSLSTPFNTRGYSIQRLQDAYQGGYDPAKPNNTPISLVIFTPSS